MTAVLKNGQIYLYCLKPGSKRFNYCLTGLTTNIPIQLSKVQIATEELVCKLVLWNLKCLKGITALTLPSENHKKEKRRVRQRKKALPAPGPAQAHEKITTEAPLLCAVFGGS